MNAGIVLRSCLFAAVQILITPPYAVVSLLTFPFGPFTRYRIITSWTRVILLALRHICRIDFRVTGAGNLPDRPCVVLSKHQSAWETLAFQLIFPPQVYVIKRELLWIPFFGWGLAMLSPIAINRSAGARAARQMLAQGRDRVARGFWVIVYPEGTRVAPGSRGTYQTAGAAIAIHAGAPVLPVAHNAGRCWRRRAFLKYPGTITVSIGSAIDSSGRKADALTREVEAWIEAEMQRIDAVEAGRGAA
jgi:1-acyl-sn-glycerol-3-phosphate acyltransferase